MYSYRFVVQHSGKLFEVSSIRLDTFSDSCGQRTGKLAKHCSDVDASCRAENWLEKLFLGYKPVQPVTVLNTVGNFNTVVSIIILYYKVVQI